MIYFCTKMAVKVTKGQLSDGTISKNTCIEDYYYVESFMVL